MRLESAEDFSGWYQKNTRAPNIAGGDCLRPKFYVESVYGIDWAVVDIHQGGNQCVKVEGQNGSHITCWWYWKQLIIVYRETK